MHCSFRLSIDEDPCASESRFPVFSTQRGLKCTTVSPTACDCTRKGLFLEDGTNHLPPRRIGESQKLQRDPHLREPRDCKISTRVARYSDYDIQPPFRCGDWRDVCHGIPLHSLFGTSKGGTDASQMRCISHIAERGSGWLSVGPHVQNAGLGHRDQTGRY
jgi:hypothetical protein